MRQAIILAGGKGTRLRERLNGKPKPLIDICGVPLLERQILLLKEHNFTKILILVNYGAQQIIEFCGKNKNWGLDITCVDDGVPKGTAGATLASIHSLEDEFLVVYGDTMLAVDLERFWQYHLKQKGADATLFVHPNDHPSDSDLLEVSESGRVIAFYPYPHSPGVFHQNLVNAGLYVIKRNPLKRWVGRSEMLDFGKDIFPEMLSFGLFLSAYNSPEYIKDCGTPARLDKVIGDFTKGKIQRANLGVTQKAVFLDRDGVLNQEVGHLCDPSQMNLIPDAAVALKRLEASEYKRILVTNQPVIARGQCTFEGLRQIHNKMESLLGAEGAYLDRLLFCPHHPDIGFKGEVSALKFKCNCRKPEIGMIKSAEEQLSLDLSQSWLIGDSTADILAASRAGLRSILVETGHAGLDCKYSVIPDFTLPDILTAAEFIVSGYELLMKACEQRGKTITSGDIIFIGGLSRSGKSNVASALCQMLAKKGIQAHRISIDRWLRNEADRGEGVVGRYDLAAIRSVAELVRSRETKISLSLPFYEKRYRRSFADVDRIEIDVQDVVVFEGTVALSILPGEENCRSHYWFVSTDESIRRCRVIGEYLRRGYSRIEAEQIYVARQTNETPHIVASAQSAQVFLNM